MPDQATPSGQWPRDRQGELLARRRRRRQQLRRRRLLAAGSLAGIAAAIAVVVTTHAGSGNGRAPSQRTSSSPSPTPPPRGSQAGWRPHRGPVPILEYHVLGPAPSDAPYPELYVTRPDFHRQMDWLDRHGYVGVTLEEVEAAWYHGGTLPPKPVVISFDDGYRPQFTYALPELGRHGWPGVLNLKAEGSDLYPSNVKAMIDAGWELAAHSIHHLDLTTLGPDQLREEVAGARAILRREYGVPVRNYCYPAGSFDATVIAAVEAAGYVGATTEVAGYASRGRPYELDRFEILGSTGVGGLAADLASG
jgi:peptidoglycan/xylan/chitin deacetylase (PgdA/CDA1 family)